MRVIVRVSPEPAFRFGQVLVGLCVGVSTFSVCLAFSVDARPAPLGRVALPPSPLPVPPAGSAPAPVDKPQPTAVAVAPTPLPPRPKVAAIPRSRRDCEHHIPPESVSELVATTAEKHGMDPRLLQSVVDQESGSRPCATSVAGAAGLMQLMPGTARQFGVRNVYDPKQNVEAGTKYLKFLLERYGNDLSLALAAYNAGPQTIDQQGAAPRVPRETENYVRGVLRRFAGDLSKP